MEAAHFALGRVPATNRGIVVLCVDLETARCSQVETFAEILFWKNEPPSFDVIPEKSWLEGLIDSQEYHNASGTVAEIMHLHASVVVNYVKVIKPLLSTKSRPDRRSRLSAPVDPPKRMAQAAPGPDQAAAAAFAHIPAGIYSGC